MALSISAEDRQCWQFPPSGCLGSQLSSPTPLQGLFALLRNKPLKMLISLGSVGAGTISLGSVQDQPGARCSCPTALCPVPPHGSPPGQGMVEKTKN